MRLYCPVDFRHNVAGWMRTFAGRYSAVAACLVCLTPGFYWLRVSFNGALRRACVRPALTRATGWSKGMMPRPPQSMTEDDGSIDQRAPTQMKRDGSLPPSVRATYLLAALALVAVAAYPVECELFGGDVETFTALALFFFLSASVAILMFRKRQRKRSIEDSEAAMPAASRTERIVIGWLAIVWVACVGWLLFLTFLVLGFRMDHSRM
jgi:hypothetical protein